MEDKKIVEGLDNIVLSIQKYRDSIIQLQRNNKKLNDDILALEKEKSVGYTSFNTETHVLVTRQKLKDIVYILEEASECAVYARDEAESAVSSAEDAGNSATNAEDYAKDGIRDIEEILRATVIQAKKAPAKKAPAMKEIDKNMQKKLTEELKEINNSNQYENNNLNPQD